MGAVKLKLNHIFVCATLNILAQNYEKHGLVKAHSAPRTQVGQSSD